MTCPLRPVYGTNTGIANSLGISFCHLCQKLNTFYAPIDDYSELRYCPRCSHDLLLCSEFRYRYVQDTDSGDAPATASRACASSIITWGWRCWACERINYVKTSECMHTGCGYQVRAGGCLWRLYEGKSRESMIINYGEEYIALLERIEELEWV